MTRDEDFCDFFVAASRRHVQRRAAVWTPQVDISPAIHQQLDNFSAVKPGGEIAI